MTGSDTWGGVWRKGLPVAPGARNAAGAVAPGGTLLVISHDKTNLEHGYGGPQDPAVLTSPDQVAAALEDFDIEKAERVNRDVETADGPRVGNRPRRPGPPFGV